MVVVVEAKKRRVETTYTEHIYLCGPLWKNDDHNRLCLCIWGFICFYAVFVFFHSIVLLPSSYHIWSFYNLHKHIHTTYIQSIDIFYCQDFINYARHFHTYIHESLLFCLLSRDANGQTYKRPHISISISTKRMKQINVQKNVLNMWKFYHQNE